MPKKTENLVPKKHNKHNSTISRSQLINTTLTSSFPMLLFTIIIMWLATKVTTTIIILIVILSLILFEYRNVTTQQQPMQPTRLLKNTFYTLAYLWFIILLSGLLGPYGLAGLFTIVLLITTILLWKRRDTYIWWLRYIEKEYFGMTREEQREQRRRNTK